MICASGTDSTSSTAVLFQQFSHLQTGSWRNRLALASLRFAPVPDAEWHPVRRVAMFNQPELPIVTWVIAQK
jgi:hypothetical protein